MKIVIDCRFYGLEHTGLGRYTINLISNLQKLDRKNEYVALLRKKYHQKLKLEKNWTKELFDIDHYSVKEQLLLPRVLRRIKPDIYHALQLNFPVLYSGKSVVTIHDTTQLEINSRATTLVMPLYYIKLVGIHTAFSYIKKKANTVIVPTKEVKSSLVKRGVVEKKVEVIYEGFEHAEFSSMKSSDILETVRLKKNKYFFYLGNAYPHKNLELAIQSVKLLNRDSKEKIYFVIAGSRSVFTKRLDAYIRNLDAQSFVKQIGYVSDADLVTLLKNSIGFVYPSLKEGFGLPGLEALSAGTLLLASDIPVFQEVYRENALYFDPQDVDSLVKKMNLSVSMKNETRINRIDAGKEFVKKYSWKKMAKETLTLYEDVFKNPE